MRLRCSHLVYRIKLLKLQVHVTVLLHVSHRSRAVARFSFNWTSTIVVPCLIDLYNTSGWTWFKHQFLTIEVNAIASFDWHSSIALTIIELELDSRSETYTIPCSACRTCRSTALVSLVVVANVPALFVVFPQIHIVLVTSLAIIITIWISYACYRLLLLLLHILIWIKIVYNSIQMLGQCSAMAFRLGLPWSLNVLWLLNLSCLVRV